MNFYQTNTLRIAPQVLMILSVCLALFFYSKTYGAVPASVLQQPTLAPMIEKTSPAVVNISTRTISVNDNPLMQDPFFRQLFQLPQSTPRQRQSRSAGSGVIVNAKEGTIVTNHHVVEGADEITVHFSDGMSTIATLVGSDPDVDIAVLKVKDLTTIEDRASLPLGDADKLRVGDFVVAIGNPFGLGQTVTTGIVSALGRSGLGIEGYENFIQTDASINPGNSGGALVNLSGELVGINTAIIAPAGGNVGIGFAIPTNMMNASLQQILEHGIVKRGKIGVLIQDLTPALAQAFNLETSQKGVLIAQVQRQSAAADAGMQRDDIVVEIDGKSVKNVAQLRNRIGLKQIGDEISVAFLRDGREKTASIVIGDSRGIKTAKTPIKDRQPLESEPRLDGILFEEVDSGILVASITPRSPGAYTGLQAGDIIESANRQSVTGLQVLADAINPRATLLLRILRNDQPLYLVIQ